MNDINGKAMHVGDIVWWNNYECSGRVARLVEKPDDLAAYGLVEPGIFICTDIEKQQYTEDVFYAERYFKEAEIEVK